MEDKGLFGLGNPDQEYHSTRHNIGFRVLDAILENDPDQWSAFQFRTFRGTKGPAGVEWSESKTGKGILVKPMHYMNRSGECVRSVLDECSIKPENALVICDDVHLKLGFIRFREKGSSGGQNGLRSVIEEVETDRFCRLRVGIGSDEMGPDLSEFVLSDFSGKEISLVRDAVKTASQAALFWLENGIQAAMNKYNVKQGD